MVQVSKEIITAIKKTASLKYKITCWYREKENGEVEFNHYENSWSNLDKPIVLYDSVEQKQWENLKWKKKFAILYDGIIFEKGGYEN